MGKESSTFVTIETPLQIHRSMYWTPPIRPSCHDLLHSVCTSLRQSNVQRVSWRDLPYWLEVLGTPRLASNAVVWNPSSERERCLLI